MKTKLQLLACLLCVSAYVNAQSIFRKTYAGIQSLSSISVTPDGGYIMGGTEQNLTNPSNACLIKADLNGTVQWSKSFGDGIKNETSRKVILTKDGGFLMINSDPSYVFAVKTNSTGGIVWSNYYQVLSSVNTSETVNDVIELPDSSFILAGTAASGYSLLFKIDKNGTVVWGNHQGNSNIVLNKVLRLSSGELLVTGSYNSVFYIGRLNSTGTVIWAKTFPVMGSVGKSVIQSSDGNFVFAGYNAGLTMMKIDINANVYWAKSYNTGSVGTANIGLVETGVGDYLLSMYSSSYGTVTMKTDPIGNGPVTRYTGGNTTSSNELKITPDGGYVFTNGVSLNKVNATAFMCTSTAVTFTATGIAPVATNVSPVYNTYMGTISQTFYNFPIPITVASTCGGKCTTTDNLTAAFNCPDTVCQGAVVTLGYAGSGSVSSYAWSENYLVFSNTASPSRSFNVPGTYKIKLVTFNGSCQDSSTKYITVRGDCGTNGTSVNFWQKSYTNFANGTGIERTSDGGFALAGSCSLAGTPDMSLVKTDSNGVVQWGRSYGGGSLSEYAKQVRQTTDGGYILIGQDNYLFTVKVGPTGNLQWENNYQLISSGSTTTSQVVKDVLATADTGAVVIGSASGGNGMLFKINGNGSVGWVSHKSNSVFNSICTASGTDYMIVGTNTGSGNPCVVKINSTGTILWSFQYPSVSSSSGEKIIKLYDGNYMVVCAYQGTDVALLKIDPNGNLIWLKRLNVGAPSGISALEDKSNGLVLSFYSSSYGLVLYKVDAAGNAVDMRYYGGSSSPSRLVRMKSGAYAYVEGSSLRKLVAFNNLGTCSGTSNLTTPVVLAMSSPSTIVLTPNTYSVPNNVFYIASITTHVLSTPCTNTGCNLSASFNGPLTACVGQTVAFTNTSIGGTAYTWNENSVQFSNSFSTTRSFSAIGTYSIQLVVNGPGGCTGNYTINVVVSNAPVANAGTGTTIACGANTVLTGSGGTTYTWSPITGLSNPYIASPTATPSTSTTYTLTASNSGCTSTAAVTITVTGTPTVNSTGGTTICDGQTANLTASGTATTYTWMPGGQTGTSVTVAPTVTTTYTVNGYTSNCYGTSTVTVVVNPKPAVPTITQNGSQLQSSAATTYQWYLNGGLIGGAVNQNYTFTANGNYTVVVTNTFGCSNTSAVFVVTTTGVEQSKETGIGSVSIYPNPTAGMFVLETTFANGERVEISLINMLGETVQVIERSTVSGFYKKQVSTDGLGTGIYFLTIRTESGNEVRKVIKQD